MLQYVSGCRHRTACVAFPIEPKDTRWIEAHSAAFSHQLHEAFRSERRVVVEFDRDLVLLAVNRGDQHLLRQRFQHGIFEQVFDGGRRRAEAVGKFTADFHALGVGGDSRNSFVDAQAQILALDVLRWDADFLSKVECGAAFRGKRFAFPLGDGALHHLAVHIEADGFDVAMLLAAEKIACAAKFQVERGDAEASAEVAEFLEGGEALARDRCKRGFRWDQQVRVGALIGAADAAAQLVELGEAEAIGAIDDDGVGARDVEAVFDNGGGEEDVRFAANEFQHHFFELVFAHLAVADHHASFRNEARDHGGEGVDGLDAIVDEENLSIARELFLDDALDERLAERGHGGLDGEAIFWRRFDHAHIAQADERHVQRAGNGSGGHREDVDILAHFFQALFVSHAEALLFVDDEQAEILKLHVLREQAVRADDDVNFACFEFVEHFLLFFFRAEAAEHFDADGKCGEAAAESFVVLEGENGGGCEDGDLLRIGDGFEGGAHGDFRFAVADVAAEQAIHRKRGFHVALHVVDGFLLVGGFFEFKGVFEFALPIRIGREGVAGGHFALGVEFEKLVRPCR